LLQCNVIDFIHNLSGHRYTMHLEIFDRILPSNQIIHYIEPSIINITYIGIRLHIFPCLGWYFWK